MRKCQIFQNTKEGAPELGSAGAPILEVDGLLFKDLAGTGELLPYEDWRLDAKTRAKDAGIQVVCGGDCRPDDVSPHQMVPGNAREPFCRYLRWKKFPGKRKRSLGNV